MSSSFEKSVKGATKIKLAAPKSKYVEHILVATHAGEQGVAEVFRVLQNRLRDSTWTIVFKSLIIVHFMMREGEPNVTLRYLASNPGRKLAINNFTEVQTQGRNIRAYAEYLIQRVNSYGATKVDFVRNGEGRLIRLTVDKGLLRETESVQEMIRSLIRCDFLTLEPENEISLTAFRLLVMDLLVLFHVMNEGMVNILQHFFEMSKPDAERVLNIYRTFVKQTEMVVKYLSVARNYEHVTRLEIPTLKHAPTILTNQLEEYVKDADFELMRRQYLAQQGTKKGGKVTNGSSKLFESKGATSVTSEAFPEPRGAVKAPAADMIDFFESIDQNQTQMSTNPFQQAQPQMQFGLQMGPQATGFPMQQPFGVQQTGMPNQQPFATQVTGIAQQQPFGIQQTGFPQGPANPFGVQQTGAPAQQGFDPGPPQITGNPFLQMQNQNQAQPIQPNFTGAGFGGYTPASQSRFTPGLASIPQDNTASFPAQQQASGPASANPFRASMLPSATGSSNPFAKPGFSPFQPQPQAQGPLAPALTGTNPFARASSVPPVPTASASPFGAPFGPPAGTITTHVTGSTNPFRKSQFVNQTTGGGWQSGPQGTIGGVQADALQTTTVFPRPGVPQNGMGWGAAS